MIEAKDRETVAELAQIEIPILALNDVEIDALLPQFGLEVPTEKNVKALQVLIDGYEAQTGEVRTILQALVVLSHREMDETFHDWMVE